MLSLTLHAISFIAVRDLLYLPKLDLEFQLPSEAEFGVVDGQDEGQDEGQGEPNQASSAQSAPETKPSAPETAAPEQAAPTQPATKPKPASREEPLPASLATAGGAARLAPKGTQLALRLDLERIRASPFADETNTLLTAIPDVRALLDGSGVEPLRDLSRLFLASPDLRREHVVMAGRYVGDESVPRDAVERLAQQKGVPAPWRQQRGVSIAPWRNHDATVRVVALLGPSVFVITREDDLRRVLAAARARRSAHSSPADAFVQMDDERELLHATVEDARRFVRGARAKLAPDQLSISVRERASDAGQLEVEAIARYPVTEDAEVALQYWQTLRSQYASHPLLALMNLDRLLRDLTLERDDKTLTARVVVPERQARLLLRFARDSLRGPEPPPTAPSPTPSRP